MRNPLLDYDFLKQLDVYPHKTVYAKIILLDFNEAPIQEIQGRISAGSINVDGASVIRRTCSLTMLTNEEKIDNIYWGLKNKFKLEIGLENHINADYPEIIWFKQGLYIITGLNESVNSSGHTIGISGKDKGCLINGEIGGTIGSTTDFGRMDVVESDGSITTVDIPIKEIIKNAMITFGGEDLHNIIINDIDNYGMELMAYKGDTPLYMMFNEDAQMVTNMTFNDSSRECEYWDEDREDRITGNISFSSPKFVFNSYVEQVADKYKTLVQDPDSKEYKYSVIKFNKDDSVGYRKTELTYPGDLIANPGDTVSSILDKIKNMFSTFEYFYDINGKFVFQKKKTYLNNSWNNVQVSEDEIYVDAAALSSQTFYSFNDNLMFTSISKQPNLLNLRNDFSIQGTRKTATGANVSIHMRYALSDKPVKYYSLSEEKTFVSYEYMDYIKETKQLNEENFAQRNYYIQNQIGKYERAYKYDPTLTYYYGKNWDGKRYDWRELIYQMAVDYYKYNQDDDFLIQVAKKNPEYFPTGKTGYEIFYIDMQGFWRQLYNPEAIGASAKEYIELNNSDTTERYSTRTGFNENVEKNPALLNFWIDFMDTSGEMGKYSIQTIGHRPKAINDSNVAAIYYKQVPQVLFISGNELNQLSKKNLQDYYNLSGYNFIQITSAYEKYFSIGARSKSAQDVLDELLLQHLYCSENIVLTSIPIYYLQPNYRIFVHDTHTNIGGEYIVNKITIPLTYNGTSSITAQLAPNRIY